MNPHLSPFTACTNLVLQATVDQLIQQAAFCSVPSTVSSRSLLASSSGSVLPVDPVPHVEPLASFTCSSLATTASPSVKPSWFLSGANSCSFIQAPAMPATVHVLCTNHLALPLAAFLPTTLQPVVASAQSSIFDDHASPLHLHYLHLSMLCSR